MLLGPNYSVERGIAFFGPAPKLTNYGLLVAFSYNIEAERFWARFTPQYVFPLEGYAAYPGYLKAGLPLVEVGVHLGALFDLSLGLCATPLRVGIRF